MTAQGIRRRTPFEPTPALRSRFEDRVHNHGPDECWEFLGAQRNGYGAIKHKGKVLSAHVVAWVLAGGEFPRDGWIVCHTCDNRLCCNPRHLYLGTYAENIHDMDRRRVIPRPKGIEIPWAKLNSELVRAIWAYRRVLGLGRVRIGRELGLDDHLVDSVLRGKAWCHVEEPTPAEAKELVSQFSLTKRHKKLDKVS